MTPPPAQVPTWPAVFDGVGALFVRCDNDPDVQAERIPGLTWVAPKVNGDDITGPEAIHYNMDHWRARGRTVGAWIWNFGPPASDVLALAPWQPLPFVVYNVEAPYKTDEGAPAQWPADLVSQHRAQLGNTPAAVTSYGAIPGEGNWPSSIDFGAFARAGWPILAQCYDSYAPERYPHAEDTYRLGNGKPYPGPYAPAGIHRLLRSLQLAPGEAVYRPESL